MIEVKHDDISLSSQWTQMNVKVRGGTAAEIAAYTGTRGEIVYDTTNSRAILMDGSTAGGTPLANAVGPASTLTAIIISASDETSPLTIGTGKVTFPMPYGFTLSEVRATVKDAPTGADIIVDINEDGTTILSTKLRIDATGKTSVDSLTPAVISDANLAEGAEMTVDFDQVGSTIAGKSLKVILLGHQA